jgi:foldase protein PrsA
VSKAARAVAALGAVCISIGCLAACGGGIPSNAVVQIDGRPITKETFKHWLGVAAAASATTAAGQKAIKPVVPEPPAYTACIAHLQAIEPKPDKGQQAKTVAALKTECEQQYESLEQQTLGFLTSLEWVFDEAKDKGIEVSDKQVMAHFEELKREQFPKEAVFQKFLADTGQTVADLLVRVKLSMISTKLQEKVTKSYENVSEAQIAKYYAERKSEYVKGKVQQSLEQVKSTIRQQLIAQGQQAALAKFGKELQGRWKARTECRPEYVVQECAQYKAPKTTTSGALPTTTG